MQTISKQHILQKCAKTDRTSRLDQQKAGTNSYDNGGKEMIDQCGVAEHAEDCLCDVVITTPTPINVTSVSDLWGGDAICNIFDMAGPWEPDNLLEFFEKLLYGYDNHRGSPTSIRHIRPRVMERSGNESFPSYWKRLRTVLDDVYHESPDANIEDVLEMLGISVDHFRDCFLYRTSLPDWDIDMLKEMQADARSSIGHNKFATKYRLNPDKGRTGDVMYRMLGGTFRVHVPGGPGSAPSEQQRQVEQYVAEHPHSTRDMIVAWHKETFPTTTRSGRSKQISRALKKERNI